MSGAGRAPDRSMNEPAAPVYAPVTKRLFGAPAAPAALTPRIRLSYTHVVSALPCDEGGFCRCA